VPISQYPEMIQALAMIKLAAARANHDCGKLQSDVLKGIEAACQEIINGALHDQFPVDVIQGGAGTSTNMNANEVIANRALEIMGFNKGEYEHCDPHDQVNLSQSTNDAYPSALHVAIAVANTRLIGELRSLVASLRDKGSAFAHVLKMGRTQMQDAVPMTLGQEFDAWAESLENEIAALTEVEGVLLEVNMGGTAIGTGLNAPEGYAERCVEHLVEITGKAIRLAPDLVEATQDTQPFVLYSSCLKSLAIKLSKICNDLRLLSSGPRAGLNEINLPRMQPGSSIMPGKVNPVIPEVVNQVCFRAIGSDLTVTLAAEAGQLQLNVMEPVIAYCDPPRALCRGNHGQRGYLQGVHRAQHRRCHGVEPGARLRRDDRAGQRSAGDRKGHRRAGAGKGSPQRVGNRSRDGPGTNGGTRAEQAVVEVSPEPLAVRGRCPRHLARGGLFQRGSSSLNVPILRGGIARECPL